MHAAHTFRGPQQEEDAELLALQRIDDTSVKLQQEGKYLEALECMERGLVLRQHFFGADSEEVWRACKTVGEMCNLLAMTYLQQGSWRRAYVRPRWLTRTRLLLFAEDFAMVLELLKKADILTERDPPGRAVTYNNLACYYRRQGKLHAALSYLQKSLKIEAGLSSDDVENPADTHLNMCAVLSQLGRHQSALEHAQSALILLQEELFGGMNAGGDAPQKADRVAVLAIAYHNIGVEQEFLKKFQQSVASYGKGVEVAKTHLGPSHGITITLKNSLIAARRAISAKKGPKKSGTTRRKKGGRGVGRPMNPSDSNVEKWGNITGVYGDIPGVKGVEKQKKSTRGECNDGARCAAVMYGSPSPGLWQLCTGKRRKHRPGASTPTAGSTGARGSVAAPPPQGDEPGASQQMLDMVTPRRGEPDDEGGAGEGGPTYGSVAAEESKRGADFEFPSFPGSCSSLLAKHLTREVYDELVMVATPQGHTLGDLCRQGVRNPSLAPLPGHAAALGVAAPDADAYDVFAPLLAPILEEHHAGANLAKANHVSSAAALDASHVTLPPEATAGAVSAASVLVCRNVAGEPFLPVLGREGRQRVESAVLAALEGGGIAGTYIPLAEIDDAGDVGARALSAFGRAGISLDAPSPNDAASGAGSEWPTVGSPGQQR